MQENKTIVFDGDDTLWYVEWKYSQAYADYFSYIYRVFNQYAPSYHDLYRRFFEIEKENTRTWGIRRGRVAESMLMMYREICRQAIESFRVNKHSAEHEEVIRVIGDQPFDLTQHTWVPGAEDVLRSLVGKGYELCLLTKYDRTLWPEKAALLGVSRFFAAENILTVDNVKCVDDFLKVARAHGRSSELFYAVGNSEGDLAPVEADERWHGFLIPHLTTFMPDQASTTGTVERKPSQNPRSKKLRSIRELLSYL